MVANKRLASVEALCTHVSVPCIEGLLFPLKCIERKALACELLAILARVSKPKFTSEFLVRITECALPYKY